MVERRECGSCHKSIAIYYYNKDSGERCIFCMVDDPNYIHNKPAVSRKERVEVIEDKGCAGGACTL